MTDVKPTLLKFRAALQALLNEHPDIFITVNGDGDVLATDLEAYGYGDQSGYCISQLQVLIRQHANGIKALIPFNGIKEKIRTI